MNTTSSTSGFTNSRHQDCRPKPSASRSPAKAATASCASAAATTGSTSRVIQSELLNVCSDPLLTAGEVNGRACRVIVEVGE